MPRRRRSVIDRLSPQEQRILRAKALGQTNKEVAGGLGLSDQTIKNHVTSILRKLEVANLVEALRAVGWLAIPGADAPASNAHSVSRRELAAQLRDVARAIEADALV